MSLVELGAGRLAGRSGPLRRPDRLIAWPAVLPLLLMVATEYKLRRRDIGEALGGRPDIAIIAELAVFAAVTAYCLLTFATPLRVRRAEPVLYAMWGYAATLAISSFYAPYPVMAVVRGTQLLVVAGVAHAIATRATREHLQLFTQAYTVLVGASVVIGFVFDFPAFSRLQEDRFTWLYVHPVIAAVFLAIAVTVGVSHVLRPVRVPGLFLPRPLALGVLGLNVTGLLLTKTRGSLFGGALGVMVVIVASRPRHRRAEMVVVLVASIVGAVVVFWTTILAFLTRGDDAERIGTLSGRTELWSLAWDAFLERPLFGYGFGASRGMFYDDVGLGGAHNAYVNVIVDVGLVGLAWWLFIIGALVVSLRRLARLPSFRRDVAMLQGVLFCSLGNGLTTEGLGAGVSVAAIWLFMLVAFVIVLQRSAAAPTPPVKAMPPPRTAPDPVAPPLSLAERTSPEAPVRVREPITGAAP